MIMRALAALAFAGLLTLMLATVGIRTASLRARARIEQLRLSLQASRYEIEHRRRELAATATPAALAELLRACVLRTRGE
jgi:hypothetical protein